MGGGRTATFDWFSSNWGWARQACLQGQTTADKEEIAWLLLGHDEGVTTVHVSSICSVTDP